MPAAARATIPVRKLFIKLFMIHAFFLVFEGRIGAAYPGAHCRFERQTSDIVTRKKPRGMAPGLSDSSSKCVSAWT